MLLKTSNLLKVVHLSPHKGKKNLPKRFYINQFKDALGGKSEVSAHCFLEAFHFFLFFHFSVYFCG